MKKYKRHVTIDELRARCAAAGVPLDTYRYDHDGHDFVVVGERPNEVYFNTFNGQFCTGMHHMYGPCNEESALDHEPWYAMLLDFLFTNEELPCVNT